MGNEIHKLEQIRREMMDFRKEGYDRVTGRHVMGHPRYYTSRNSFPRWRAAYGGRDARKSFATVTAGGHYVDALFINTWHRDEWFGAGGPTEFRVLASSLASTCSNPGLLFRIFSPLINLPFRAIIFSPTLLSLETKLRSKSRPRKVVKL